jgi:HAE1 family hydrophobic/amphiphilic exporter-1
VGGGAIGWAIERPVSVTVGVILVVLFGMLSVATLPIQLTPDITVPTVTVTTNWPGATPLEVETDVLEPQEKVLKSLPGLERMTSEARRDQGSVTLELAVGTPLEEALVRVSNLLSQVPAYPEAADEPAVSTASSAGPPLAVTVVQSVPPGRQVAEYRTWIAETVVPQLERIRGVASIRMVGGRDLEVHVDFDPAALAARHLTIGQVSRAVRAELRDVSGGDIPLGKRRYVVRTELAPASPEDLEALVLGSSEDGTPVRLGDVGKVAFGLRKANAVAMINAKPSLAFLFFREPGYNVLEVTREIHTVTDDLNERYLASEGLAMTIVSDQVDYIEGALALVGQNLMLGGLLAVIVLLVFLRSVGASAVVAVSIPVSVIGTALGMSLMGRTVNIVSLAGMAFAVGMVVDNSIVVLENIDTWRRREPDVKKAALLGTREVWGAILASTATTAAVFIPIIAWQDEVGELLRDVAVAISISVGVSLVVSVLVIPSFAAKLLRSRATRGDPEDQDPAAAEVRGVIGRSVHWIVRSPLRAFLIAAIGLGGTGALGLALLPPMEYLPTGNRNIVFGVLIPPPGYSVEELEAIGQQIQDELLPHTGAEVDGKPSLARAFFVGSPDQAFMGAVADDPTRIGEVAPMLRAAQAKIPGAFGFASQASLFGRRLGGGRAIEMDIRGPDLTASIMLGIKLMGAIRQALPGSQVRPIPGLDLGAPELRVRPNRAEAAALGVSSADLGLMVSAIVDGAIIGELGRSGEPKRNVVLRARNVQVSDPESLAATPVATAGGEVAPLSQLIEVEEALGPLVIQRIERARALTLQIDPPQDVPLEEAIRRVSDDAVEPLRAAGEVPEGVRIEYSGSAGKLDETKVRFAWVLLLAIIISYLLLAALFEDFLAPLAILVSVPLAGAGGILSLWAVDKWLGAQPLDMMTALGFVILIGVVVNNAILVVDGALARLRDGMDLGTATAEAVRRRVRPIFMSALTSLAGLAPLVLFPGSGSELYRGVGAVVLGGLALSTVLTLFLVPAVFTLLWRLRRLVAPRPFTQAAPGATAPQ